jgi:hypothetical protein
MSGNLFDLEHDPFWQDAKRSFRQEPKDLADFKMLSFSDRVFLAYAAVAAPNPDNPPFYLDMPFTLVDGEPQIVPEVFEKINALDSINDVRRYLNQSTRLRGLMIYVDTDESDIPEEALYTVDADRRFDQALTELGVQHEFVEVEATHCNYDITPVIKFMDAHLAF